jgi:predicted amidohydrolase YtcJ
MLIGRAEVEGIVRDVRIRDGRITEVGDRLKPMPDEDVVDARGGALIPGLHDHHIHLRALAAASLSVFAGPPEVTTRDMLANRLRAAASRHGWIRAVGYHESVAGPLDAAALDAFVGNRPLRVQHRSGSLWMLNSAAIAATRLDESQLPGIERDCQGVPTGRLWRMDDWLRTVTPQLELDFTSLGATEAMHGITAFTDATPSTTLKDVADLVAACRSGSLAQRVHLMAAIVPESSRICWGPQKIVLDEARLSGVAQLAAQIDLAHLSNRAVAIHCVTRAELVLALTALDVAGPRRGDRIEHASLVPPEVIPILRRLRVTVVTQPNFVYERGDAYVAEIAATDFEDLYRLRSLASAGVPLAAGTDAPFGSPDPWRAVAAACDRLTRDGHSLGPNERLAPPAALKLFLGHANNPGSPRRVRVGTRDMVLLRLPLGAALAQPSAECVALTLIDGVAVYDGR